MASPGFGKDMFSNLKAELPAQLPAYLKGQRWFGAKTRNIQSVRVVDWAELPAAVAATTIVPPSTELPAGSISVSPCRLIASPWAPRAINDTGCPA